jgi:hypothetical protein
MKSLSLLSQRNLPAKHGIRIIDHEGARKGAHKRVCAWCCKVIQEGEFPATHGICPECAKEETVRYLEETKPFPRVSARNH